MFFYPDSATYTTPAQLGVRAEDVQIVTADGSRLHGWFLPAVGNANGTVLHLHGNAANVSNHLPLVSWLPARGYNVLMVDYRGFGRSQGKPSLDGIVDDAAAAVAYLRTRPLTRMCRSSIFLDKALAAPPRYVCLRVIRPAFGWRLSIRRSRAIAASRAMRPSVVRWHRSLR